MNKKSLIIILFIVIIPILLSVGYFYSDKITLGGNNILSSKNWVIPTDWKVYENTDKKYEIKYPPDFKVFSESSDRVDFNPSESGYPHYVIFASKTNYQNVTVLLK